MVYGNVLELKNPLRFSFDSSDEGINKMMSAFFETQFIIDLGTEHNVVAGDLFCVIEKEKKILSLSGEEIGTIEEEGSLLKAISTYQKFSICRLETYSYMAHMDALYPKMNGFAKEDGTIDFENYVTELSPVVPGQKVILINQEEKVLKDALDDLYHRTLGEDVSKEEKVVLYIELIRKANEIFSNNPTGYFASNALFQKGYAQFQLKSYQDAIITFREFLDKYPFNVSANGALSWIAEATKEINQQRAEALLEPEKDSGKKTFDVFLSYNSADRSAVREINLAFQSAGIVTWLDEEQLVPGKSWRAALEEQIININKVCVFVGSTGTGPWQDLEVSAILDEFVRKRATAIPVILPGLQDIPTLPLFLRQMTWIDLRTNFHENLLKLIRTLKRD